MRDVNELSSRLAFIFANSLSSIKYLKWNESSQANTYTISITSGDQDELAVIGYSGSALVRLNGRPYFALDGYHNEIPLPPGNNEITAEFQPYQAFGERVKIDPGTPVLIHVNRTARELWSYGNVLLELANGVDDAYIKERILNLLGNALSISRFQGITRDQLLVAAGLNKKFPQHLTSFIDGYDLQTKIDEGRFEEALNYLRNGLKSLREEIGKRGQVVGVGHAHIDAAWLWSFDETKRKIARTFSTVVKLMKEHDFHFIQSSAMYYKWLHDYYPALFNEVKRLVEEGRWELGAGWIEFDANITSGESIVRQLLYSQRYFLETFGKIAEVLWLPDTFGFSAQLPQLMRLAGIKLFATHKVFWNDTNKFPYSLFEWVGIDGSSIPSIAFGNGGGGYGSTFNVNELLQQWREWRDKDKPMLYAFGYGDGGGGPTDEMLIRAKAVDEAPLLPRVSLGGITEAIKHASPVNRWRGELYLENHRGVYTSHSKMKYLHRRAEFSLRDAEIWSTLAESYDGETIKSLWMTIMKNEFHDVLPGSAINDVYREVYPEIEKVIKDAEAMARSAIMKIAGDGAGCIAFNSLSWDREDYAVVEEELPGSQKVMEGYLVRLRAPSMGYAECVPLDPGGGVAAHRMGDRFVLENRYLRAVINDKGMLESLFDKENGVESLRNASNRIIAYENIPGWADAWNIEPSFEETYMEIHGSNGGISEDGPLRACVDFDMNFGNSVMKQSICMYAGKRRIDFKTTLRLVDRELLLKSWFDFNLNTDAATFEIPYGVLRRETTTNTTWNRAMFEVPMQKWLDVSQDDYGVAVLNDSKYGATVRESKVGLSLAKSPLYPDPLTDMEYNTFTYSIYPHPGDWFSSGVFRAAYELNSPLKIIKGRAGRRSFVEVSNSELIVESIKASEEGGNVVVRLYNVRNSRGRGWVKLWFNPRSARAVDILEMNDVGKPIDISGDKVVFDYGPHEIITLLLN